MGEIGKDMFRVLAGDNTVIIMAGIFQGDFVCCALFDYTLPSYRHHIRRFCKCKIIPCDFANPVLFRTIYI
jgi:hypothetical protein